VSFIVKTLLILAIAVTAIYFALSHEGEKKEARIEKAAGTPSKSTAQTAVDGFTGKTAVHMGKKARQSIDKVNTSRSEDIKDVEGQ